MAISIKNNFGPIIHNEAGATVNVSAKDALETYTQALRNGLFVDEIPNPTVSSSPELCNYIFTSKVFNTNSRVVRLRDAIGARIKGAKLIDSSGLAEDRTQIDPSMQNEWYYIWKMVKDSGLLSRKVTVRAFIGQMLNWFPEVFEELAEEEQRAVFVRKMEKSISAEKRKWNSCGQEVPFKDMNHKWSELHLDWKIVEPKILVCRDLRDALQNLKSAIEQEEAAKGVR